MAEQPMSKSKYKDKVYDGRWKVVLCKDNKYTLENIYNHNQIVVANDTMTRIDKGETTISNIMSYRACLKGFNPMQPYPTKPKSYKRQKYATLKSIQEKGD